MDRIDLSQGIEDALQELLDNQFHGLKANVVLMDSLRKDIESPFIMAAIDAPEGYGSRSKFAQIVVEIFKKLSMLNSINEFGGIEIIFRRHTNHRIARISSSKLGYVGVQNFQGSDWENPSPFDGVGCWVYEDDLKLL